MKLTTRQKSMLLIWTSLGLFSCKTNPDSPLPEKNITAINARVSKGLTLAELAKTLPAAPLVAGFDLDDTLYSSTPAFISSLNKWKSQGNTGDSSEALKSESFWIIFNNSFGEHHHKRDLAVRLMEMHRLRGDRVVVITARGQSLKESMTALIARDFNLTLKSDGNFQEVIYTNNIKSGKTPFIRNQGIKIYYGDSDSDIEAAREAGARGIRILRSEDSAYLSDYNPGKYQEEILSET